MMFAACNKEVQTDPSTTTTTETTIEDIEPTLSAEEAKTSIVGTWYYDETISPQKFYGDYYNEKITKTSVQMRTTHTFHKDGSYNTQITITNISAVRKEYRSLMVEGARINSESQGKFLTTAQVTYYEKYADKILNDICKQKYSTYKIEGNKLVFGDSTTETFALYKDKLVFENSQSNDGSKIVFKRK